MFHRLRLRAKCTGSGGTGSGAGSGDAKSCKFGTAPARLHLKKLPLLRLRLRLRTKCPSGSGSGSSSVSLGNRWQAPRLKMNTKTDHIQINISNEWMDERTNEWMNEWMVCHYKSASSAPTVIKLNQSIFCEIVPKSSTFAFDLVFVVTCLILLMQIPVCRQNHRCWSHYFIIIYFKPKHPLRDR